VDALTHRGAASGFMVLGVAVISAVLLVRRELPQATPLVPIDLLKIPLFALSIGTSATSFVAQMAAFVALPFFLQGPLGRSTVETGLLMTAWPVTLGLVAPIAGRFADRLPAGILGSCGLATFALGLISLSLIRAATPDFLIVAAMALSGAGFAFFLTPNGRALVSVTPRHRSGAAGGAVATGRLLGQSTGAMVTAIIFHLMGPQAASVALAVAAAITVAAIVVSVTRLTLTPPGPRKA
jgi:DHA2 family multidrug resistance protein-like MFS transporter